MMSYIHCLIRIGILEVIHIANRIQQFVKLKGGKYPKTIDLSNEWNFSISDYNLGNSVVIVFARLQNAYIMLSMQTNQENLGFPIQITKN